MAGRAACQPAGAAVSPVWVVKRSRAGRGPSQDVAQHGAGVGRVDHVVDLERHGGAERLAAGVLLGDQLLVPRLPGLGVADRVKFLAVARSEEHTSELQSQSNLVCRLLLE